MRGEGGSSKMQFYINLEFFYLRALNEVNPKLIHFILYLVLRHKHFQITKTTQTHTKAHLNIFMHMLMSLSLQITQP